MRTWMLVAVAPLLAQQIPIPPANCSSGTTGDIRCSCQIDPKSRACEMYKSGMYEPTDFKKLMRDNPGARLFGGSGGGTQTRASVSSAPSSATAATARRSGPAPKARMVALAHTDYLRFLHPNAQMAMGIDFQKVFSMADMMGIVFNEENGRMSSGVMAALKEMDHMWLSMAGPLDFVMVMTGRFGEGQAAGMFYSQGVSPVFLSGAQAMMVGPESSIRAALARLQAPAAEKPSWVTSRARKLARDHEVWVAVEPKALAAVPAAANDTAAFAGVREFSFGAKLEGEMSIDGELDAASSERAAEIATWVQEMKDKLKLKTGDSGLDTLTVEKEGATLRFSAKGGQLSNSQALQSDFGSELYSLITAGMPGAPARAVAQDKLKAVKQGMTRDEVLGLAGRPLSVTTIQGLELPRETWFYQAAFGKQVTIRLDGGLVTAVPAL